MNFLQILTMILTLVSTVGPVASQVIALLKAKDWAALVAYLESLLKPNPPTPVPAGFADHLKPLVTALKEHV